MPVPTYRVPVRIARGSKSVLISSLASLEEGEICYAQDENKLYVKESGSLVATASLTTPRTSETVISDANGLATFSGIGQSGLIKSISSTNDAWVALYTTSQYRTLDASRQFTADPALSSGVIAEFSLAANTVLQVTPSTPYHNGDSSATDAIYIAVRAAANGNAIQSASVEIVVYPN